VGVGRDRYRGGIGQIEDPRDSPLQRRQQLAEHIVPFVAGEPRRVLPASHLSRERDVGPLVMAVGCKVDAPRVRGAETGEVAAQIEDRHGSQILHRVIEHQRKEHHVLA
jgi:hypothetical protein